MKTKKKKVLNKFHEINMMDMTSGRSFFKGGPHKNHKDKRNRSANEWKQDLHEL